MSIKEQVNRISNEVATQASLITQAVEELARITNTDLTTVAEEVQE